MALFTSNVCAETIYTERAFNYVIRDGSIVIIGYFGTEDTVTVPDHIGTYNVTGIASGALTKECIQKVILPETVSVIEEGAIIEHVPTVVEDSHGETVKKDIEDKKVEDGFFIESQEYDEISSLVENQDYDIFDEKTEDAEVNEEPFEEIYSSKETIVTNEKDRIINILPWLIIVTVLGFVGSIIYKKKNAKNK